jgi:hypothetical protein
MGDKRDFVNLENTAKLIVLDDLLYSDFSRKVSKLFKKGSYHSNINLIVNTRKLFSMRPASRHTSLNSKYITVFKHGEISLKLCNSRCRFTLKTCLVFEKQTCLAKNLTITCF